MRRAPPLIVGGGPAGAAAAIRLAQAHVAATVIEKLSQPGDAICGGFLSWTTLQQLEELGLDRSSLGGHDVTHMAVFADGKRVDAALPAPAMGVSRQRLDTLLLAEAERAGAAVRRACGVRSALGRRLTLSDGDVLEPESLFLATGKHDLRGLSRVRSDADPELGLRVRLPADAALRQMLEGHIELHLFGRGYLGLVLQEDGTANACMAVRKSRLVQAGGTPAALFRQLAERSPVLAERLAGLPRDAQFDAIGHVPYGWRARTTQPGLFRLGDQAAVISSLAGEGIGIALASARRAADAWQREGAAGAIGYQRDLSRATARPVALAGLVKGLGDRPAITAALAAMPGAAALVARLTRIGPPYA